MPGLPVYSLLSPLAAIAAAITLGYICPMPQGGGYMGHFGTFGTFFIENLLNMIARVGFVNVAYLNKIGS